MDDRVVILALAALAIVLQLWAVRLMIRADDAQLWDLHFERLVRARRRVAWDAWWVRHAGYLAAVSVAVVAAVGVLGQ
jgi:hypothetical protein